MRPHDRRCGHCPSMVTVTLRFQDPKRADRSNWTTCTQNFHRTAGSLGTIVEHLVWQGVSAPLFRVETSRFSHFSVVHLVSS